MRQLFPHPNTHRRSNVCVRALNVFVNIERASFAFRYQICCHSAISSVCSLHTLLFFSAHNPFSPCFLALLFAVACSAISSHRLQCVFCSRYQPTDLNSLLFFFCCSLSQWKSLCISSLCQAKAHIFKATTTTSAIAMRCNRRSVACLT